MKLKTTVSALCAAVLAVTCCASSAYAAKVGVSMPTQSLQRWNQDGQNMKAMLEQSGHTVDLQYAGDNDIPTQVNQIENMIASGCDILVVASIDGSALTEVLKGAKEKNIPVVSYDRLIMNSDAVSYYATFDNILVVASIDGSALTEVLKGAKEKNIPVVSYDRLIMNSDAVSYYATFDNTRVGNLQGQYIAEQLDLENAKETKYIEIFTGPTDDNNVNFFFGGAMEVLKPYIDSGKLVVKSGQTTREQCATLNWNLEEAQKRMENLISSISYGPDDVQLDAVLTQNDSLACGVVNALLATGYDASNMPVITGQDCDKPAVKNIVRGYQDMSVFKDTRMLAQQVVAMVDSIDKGEEVEVNDTTTYNNGTGVIPSYLCEPIAATKDNYQALLIDSGYYKADEI